MNTKDLQQEKQKVDEEIKQIVDYEEGIFGKWKDILNKANEIFGSTTNTGSLHYLLEAKSQALSKGISALQEQEKQVMEVINHELRALDFLVKKGHDAEIEAQISILSKIKQKLSEVFK
jgi:hypothetical protein